MKCYLTLIGFLFLSACHDKSSEASKILLTEQGLFQEVLTLIDKDYADVPDTQKIVRGALNGALNALDDYSNYYSPDEYKIFMDMTKGEFGGIGAEIKGLKDGLEVIPLDDGPAFKAGIKTGDIIIKVEDIKISRLTPIELLQKIHGDPGTPVKLTILRDQNEIDITVIREIVKFSPVKYHFEGKTAYIRISTFTEQTFTNLTKAIDDIHQKIKEKYGSLKSLQGIILDLRNNPGGTLEQAVSTTSLFLDKGIIVNVKTRDPHYCESFSSSGPDKFKDIPVVVLINKGSASASEVMAGALHDHKRAILLGEKTFGKGSVQKVMELKDKSAIKMTIAYFTTPQGHIINGQGIEPDIEVVGTPTAEQKDPQKQRAIDLIQGLSVLQGW